MGGPLRRHHRHRDQGGRVVNPAPFRCSPAKAGAHGHKRNRPWLWPPAFAGEQRPHEHGFSLIEALVALAVLAIATVGLIRAVESHVDSTRAMERRAAAMWVAENRLAEIQLADPAAAPETELLGQPWRVAVARTRTEDAGIDKVRIQVFARDAERTPLASLDGFVEGGGT